MPATIPDSDATRPIVNCRRAVTAAGAIVASVRPDDLSGPTPCDDWTVRDLIDHMSGVCFAHAEGLAGAAFDRHRLGTLFGPEPVATFDAASIRALTAYQEPDALARSLIMPWGSMAATTMVKLLVIELLLHTWDLATALGRPFAMDEDLAEQAIAVLLGLPKPQAQEFAPAIAVAAEASAQDRFLARSGRNPADGVFA